LMGRQPAPRMRMPRSRTEAFSDGVFAIAATLLIIEVHVPTPEDAGLAGSLWRALGKQWPSYAAYAVSFGVIGIMWVNHHATFDRVEHVDRTLLFCNVVLLGLVAFIPFPTALLATYLRTGNNAESQTAALTYALVMLATSSAFVLIWAYLSRHRDLLRADAEPHAPQVALRRASFGVVVYLLTVPIAAINAYAALAVFAALALFFIFAERPARDVES
jgi:uncharacterized membrane protein